MTVSILGISQGPENHARPNSLWQKGRMLSFKLAVMRGQNTYSGEMCWGSMLNRPFHIREGLDDG